MLTNPIQLRRVLRASPESVYRTSLNAPLHRGNHMKTAPLATLFLTCLLGILPVAASAQPYTISADGSEVTDQKTRLIWRRCIEGMNWDGATCAGVASKFNHEAASELAAALAKGTGINWRLPNINELSSIADRSDSNPVFDPTAFPTTPLSSSFWSATPGAGKFPVRAWYVLARDGDASLKNRNDRAYVRLVRISQ